VVKEYRAQLAAAFKRNGVSLDIFLKVNNETDFIVKRRTLFRNVKAIDEGEPPCQLRRSPAVQRSSRTSSGTLLLEQFCWKKKNGPAVGGDMDRGQF
jgi:hypothetical protein